MQKMLGTLVLIVGLIMVVTGFIVGRSGVSVPDSVLGLYNPVTAICVFGGAVTTFVGFALIAASPKPKSTR